MAAQDANFQQLSSVQNKGQIGPATIAAATTIAPTTFITFVTGTTNIATITPPVTGSVELVLIFTDASPGQFTTAGNIKLVLTTIAQNVPVLVFWNPLENKWYAKV